MASQIRVAHYVNQFFGGIGGEEHANIPVEVRPEALGPGRPSTEEEIREFCRGQIAHYKIPRYVKFVTEFPMTVTGKIQKFRMRETAIEELQLQEAAQIETA